MQPQSLLCPACGLKNPSQARFCARCGHSFQPLPQSRASSVPPSAMLPPQPPAPFASPPQPSSSPPNGPAPYPIPTMMPKSTVNQYPSQQAVHQRPPQPARRTVPPQKPPFMLRIAEFWWVQLPILFRRYWLFLAEAWHDGIYLTRWPVASLLIPLLVVLFGLF